MDASNFSDVQDKADIDSDEKSIAESGDSVGHLGGEGLQGCQHYPCHAEQVGIQAGGYLRGEGLQGGQHYKVPTAMPVVQSYDHSLDVPSSKHDHGSQSVWHDKGYKNWRGTW